MPHRRFGEAGFILLACDHLSSTKTKSKTGQHPSIELSWMQFFDYSLVSCSLELDLS